LQGATVQIVFEFDYNGVAFRDALVLPDDHTFTDTELEAMKQERFDNWVTVITSGGEPIAAE